MGHSDTAATKRRLMSDQCVDRRRALKILTTGAVGVSATSMWVDSLIAFAQQQAHAHVAQAAAAAPEWTPRVLSPQQNELVVALSEIIIPQTETPGAKAARVNRFIDTVLHEAPAEQRESFLAGLNWIDARSRARFKKGFVGAAAADQAALLTRISDTGKVAPEDRIGADFFRALKSMTIDGYYSSEIGLQQELGDSGQLFLAQFAGCDHEEHK